MSRVFAYVRVSTTDQTTDNQVREIEAAGFKVDAKRIVPETISGSSAIEQRPGFQRLLDRQFERDLIIERTQTGLERAKASGTALGRPASLNDNKRQQVLQDLAAGASVSATAQKFSTSRQTILRVKAAAATT